MDYITFQAFLLELRDYAGAQLHGSFAHYQEDRGEYVSDIDLVVSEPELDDWGDYVKPTPIERAIEIFERYEVPWESIITGAINSPRDLVTLPRPVEVTDTGWIKPAPSYCVSRVLWGIEFQCFIDDHPK